MAESASASIAAVQQGSNFQYTITLTDTGTTPIGTFWFSWVPGAGYLPDLPSFTAPAGWTATLTDGTPPANGYAIRWVATSTATALQPGGSFGGFVFTSATTPAVLFGNSTIHAPTPVATSVVYSGAPFSDPGFTFDAACFAEGTHIRTDHGDVAIEALAVGDRVVTASGALSRVLWLGHRRVDCRRHPQPGRVWPVRVLAGAFGVDLPTRDLVLSPGHAVFSDGVLIPIDFLINAATIVQEARDAVTYWHVELERHGVILSEGLPTESYLDNGNRSAFANGGGTVQMHPAFALDEHCEAVWEASGCAPLRVDGAVVARVDARLRRRAARLGHSTRQLPRRRPGPPGATSIDLMSLLQPDWYRAAYPDVAAAGMDAATHYAGWGRAEGRMPCPEVDLVRAMGLVDPLTVAITMADVVARDVDPVVHFCSVGWRERRRPNPYFDTGWYLDTHAPPDGLNPLLHYILMGEAQGLAPSRHFDPAWYRMRHALNPGDLALAHYLARRRGQQTSPLPGFDVEAHATRHSDTLLPGRDPYVHFLAGRSLSPRMQGAPHAAAA